MLIRPNPRNSFICLFACSFLYLGYLIWNANEAVPEFELDLKDVVSYAVLAVEMGGHAVAKIFAENGKLYVREKAQKMDVGRAELLTRADLVSNHLMLALLRRFDLLRVISEEKSEHLADHEVDRYRSDNYELWLGLREALSKFPSRRVPLSRVAIWVDPLDATQEFTEGLTQFVTVMACITIDGKPVFGAIHRPFANETVLGMVEHGLIDSNGVEIKIPPSTDRKQLNNRTIVVSRSHAGQVAELINRTFGSESKPPFVVEPAGGAGYKALRLVRQTAEMYIHTTAIKKWDLCAGDALIRAAGGALLSLGDGQPIDYSVRRRRVYAKAMEGRAEAAVERDELHTGGIIAALREPYSLYERVKAHYRS